MPLTQGMAITVPPVIGKNLAVGVRIELVAWVACRRRGR
jgi:hypothetical protein